MTCDYDSIDEYPEETPGFFRRIYNWAISKLRVLKQRWEIYRSIRPIKSGNFSDPTIWSTGAVPGPGDSITLYKYDVNITEPITVKNLTVYGSLISDDKGTRFIG